METKKNPSADIHQQRPLIFSFSLAVSLLITIILFEWRTKITETISLAIQPEDHMYEDLIEIPPTDHTPIPVPIKSAKLLQSLTVVEATVIEMTTDQIELGFDQEMLAESGIEQISVAHQPDEEEVADKIFIIVESPAEFTGGQTELWKFIRANLKYPKMARRMGIEGRVYIQAVIEKDGSLTNARVIKGIESACDQEALRVINLSPKWVPGKQRGRPVRTQVIIPIIYKLREGDFTPTH